MKGPYPLWKLKFRGCMRDLHPVLGSDKDVWYREWCQMYLKAAKLAEAMQLAATPNQPSVCSASPEAVSHGKLPSQTLHLHCTPCTKPLHHLTGHRHCTCFTCLPK